eukprot:scaffold5931_cov410-Prasinococcus_capsulatus_cf.AAC.4
MNFHIRDCRIPRRQKQQPKLPVQVEPTGIFTPTTATTTHCNVTTVARLGRDTEVCGAQCCSTFVLPVNLHVPETSQRVRLSENGTSTTHTGSGCYPGGLYS